MGTYTYSGPALNCYVCHKPTKDNRDICSAFCASQDDRPVSREVRLWGGDEQKIRNHRWTLDLIRESLNDLYMRYEEELVLPELDEVDMALMHIEDAMKELDALLASGLSLLSDHGNRQLPLEVA